MSENVFIVADHGLALIYFLQSDIISTLLDAGVEVIFFTDDEALPAVEARFARPGLFFEGIRTKECELYFQTVDPFIQRCLQVLRSWPKDGQESMHLRFVRLLVFCFFIRQGFIRQERDDRHCACGSRFIYL